ncbi:glycosyltransferase family 4 protein [Allonocardiopsis opalescens]|uniref:UDP-GlcNAc:undecaprenyl-phosphate GlcNAc-1-phosphate transferase n=1 Tax=Allonocardiopsis opalescens TaxID=1144618 RepID=A0A2T0QD52_9ACTN|nr:MraY family glycosyltransferase [Allonocardiopsis opalescens]PRY01783.1 UDP-GlcNAc:undecaprenyl-phosphate GlcNAc-1-phosphate transferase [Allonocardiopsis opalescens]
MREYALTILIAAAVTYLSVPFVRWLAFRFGAFTPIRARDVHTVPTPRWGGLAMYAGLVAAFLVAGQLPNLRETLVDQSWQGVLLAGLIIVIVGVVDDRWDLDPLSKLAGQVLAAGVLVGSGAQLLWLPLPDTTLVLPPDVHTVVSVVLIVVTINAVNFVDGLDGLAAGIVAIAASAFFIYYYAVAIHQGFDRQTFPAMIAAVLIGICAGFLPHNLHPARIFMGDTGAMLIGLLLASTTITVTGQFTPSVGGEAGGLVALLPMLLPILVLALPFLDLLLAVVRRTLAGKSPFAPDRKHLHHQMLGLGHSHARAVLLMYLWAGIIAFAAVTMSIFADPWVFLLGALGVAACAVLLVTLPRLRRRQERLREARARAAVGVGPGPRGGA